MPRVLQFSLQAKDSIPSEDNCGKFEEAMRKFHNNALRTTIMFSSYKI